MASRRAKTTIYTLGEEAGVSPATISKALNNSPGVSTEVRERIRKLARARNFRPRLVASRVPNICVVFPHRQSRNIHFFSYLSRIMEGVADYVEEERLEMSLYTVEREELSRCDILREFGRRSIDGAVILGASQQARMYQQLEKNYFPYYSILNAPGGFDKRLLSIDNERIGYRATRCLIELGHRIIGVLTPPMNAHAIQQRLEGHKNALIEAGLKFRGEIVEMYDEEGTDLEFGAAAVKRFLRRRPEITALFAMSHRLAVGAMHGLHTMGVSIPGQISVLGCDDLPETPFLNPPLSTIRIPNRELGYAAARRVHRLIRDLPEQDFESQINRGGELIVRASTAPPRKTRLPAALSRDRRG